MELLGELREAHRLAIAVGIRHAEVGRHVFLDGRTLVVAEDQHLLLVDCRETANQAPIIVHEAIAVQLLKVGADVLDEIAKVRSLRIPRQLHTIHRRFLRHTSNLKL